MMAECSKFYLSPLDKMRASFKCNAFSGTEVNQNRWYGIEIDTAIASPDLVRIAGSVSKMSLHATLPVHSQMKGCLLNADKSVNYYLKSDDWTKKADGTASDLTGAHGNVMVEIPRYYRKFETEGTKQRVKISQYALPDFIEVPKTYMSAYEGKLVTTKLSSISGQLPTTSRSKTQFRIDARANGSGYEQLWYAPYQDLIWLYAIEYATLNFQKPVDATLTADGYKKGGLGNGISTAISAEWSAFNGYNPFIQSGASNSLANGSGEVSVIMANFGGAGVNRTFTANRYRGIENIFGHIWKWIDAVAINHLADRREAYIFDNPAQIADGTSVNARLAGLLPNAEGWMKTALFPDILPAGVGGSSTTQYCDYFYAPALGSGWRALISGGSANYGGNAGAFAASTSLTASYTYTDFGGRLCAR